MMKQGFYISKYISKLTYFIFNMEVFILSYLTNKGEFYEKRVADYWFSWGWKDEKTQILLMDIILKILKIQI